MLFFRTSTVYDACQVDSSENVTPEGLQIVGANLALLPCGIQRPAPRLSSFSGTPSATTTSALRTMAGNGLPHREGPHRGSLGGASVSPDTPRGCGPERYDARQRHRLYINNCDREESSDEPAKRRVHCPGVTPCREPQHAPD